LEVGAVQLGDGLVAALGHLDEAEAARPAGVAVGHDLGPRHGAELAERLAEVVRGGLEGEVADVDVLAHALPLRAFRPDSTRNTDARPAGRGRQGRTGRPDAGRHCPATGLTIS